MAAVPLNHAHLLLRRLIARLPEPAHHYVYLNGEVVQSRHDTDRELPFRQESNFSYVTGCEVPEAAFVLDYEHAGGPEVNLDSVTTKLFLPEINPAEVM